MLLLITPLVNSDFQCLSLHTTFRIVHIAEQGIIAIKYNILFAMMNSQIETLKKLKPRYARHVKTP